MKYISCISFRAVGTGGRSSNLVFVVIKELVESCVTEQQYVRSEGKVKNPCSGLILEFILGFARSMSI
ncbi:hypothetical protein [Paenibacillus albidus]|uniref:hypothetical protein n=1 Tax=Paenibacillus albidus TaxID=2041023 RepID=UPI001BEC11AF|nr:hypothetical protein [Paenibacillus albidus]